MMEPWKSTLGRGLGPTHEPNGLCVYVYVHALCLHMLHLYERACVCVCVCVCVCACVCVWACVPTWVIECVHQTLSSHAFMALWALEETHIFPVSSFKHTHAQTIRARSHSRSYFVSVLSPPPVAGRLFHYLTTSTKRSGMFFFVFFFPRTCCLFLFPCCHDDPTHCVKMPLLLFPNEQRWNRCVGFCFCCKSSHYSTYLCSLVTGTIFPVNMMYSVLNVELWYHWCYFHPHFYIASELIITKTTFGI